MGWGGGGWRVGGGGGVEGGMVPLFFSFIFSSGGRLV